MVQFTDHQREFVPRVHTVEKAMAVLLVSDAKQ